MDTMKRQEDMTPEDEPLRSEGVQYATGEEQRAPLDLEGSSSGIIYLSLFI